MSILNTTMKIEGITGESKVAEGEIDIIGFHVHVNAPNTHHRYMSGQSGVGKGEVAPIPFSKLIDKATAQMMISLLRGKPLGTVTITTRAQHDGDNKTARTIVLSDAILVSQDFGSEEHENFTLAYKKFEFEYAQYDNKAAAGGKTKATYSIDTVQTSS